MNGGVYNVSCVDFTVLILRTLLSNNGSEESLDD